MADILALAFQTNKTSVATLLLCRDISGMFYPFLPGDRGTPPAVAQGHSRRSSRWSTRYYTGQLAYLGAAARSRCRRATGPCSTTRACCSCRTCGPAAATTARRVPVLTLGNLGGALESGRVLDYYKPAGREAAAVQPVSVADGSHGRRAAVVRRRDRAPRRHLMRPATTSSGQVRDEVCCECYSPRRGRYLP